MHDSFPNATYCGFTGTPIDETIAVFGKIVDSCTMKESSDDGITVRIAYDWIGQQMLSAGLMPPEGVRYPVWAWYQWEGKRKRRDMREGGHAKRGERIVQLTVEIDDKDIGYWWE